MRDNQTRLDRPLVCPVLVGRGAHRAALEACLDQACAGQGQLVLVHGEAGIGKSRLLEPLRARAVERGARVAQGACFEPDRVVPFGPFIDLLRDVLTDSEAASPLVALGPAAAELAALVPDLAVPDTGGRADSGPQQKRRLFHAIERLVDELTARQPLLQVFEDVHWSELRSFAAHNHWRPEPVARHGARLPERRRRVPAWTEHLIIHRPLQADLEAAGHATAGRTVGRRVVGHLGARDRGAVAHQGIVVRDCGLALAGHAPTARNPWPSPT